METIRNGESDPLQNHVILESIFGYCSVSDLRNVRQVSKLWHETSLKAWTSSVHVHIRSAGLGVKSMSKFLEFVVNKHCYHLETPFASIFKLDINYRQFWLVCGSTVKTLTLSGIEFGSLKVFRKIIYDSCPNLENLTLEYVTILGVAEKVVQPTEWLEPQFGKHSKLKYFAVKSLSDLQEVYHATSSSGIPSWMELLSHFPSLEALTLGGTIPNYDELLKCLSLIRERDPREANLKYINAYEVWNDGRIPLSFFRAVKDASLQLVGLSLWIERSEETFEVSEILRLHSSSLKTLVFFLGYDYPEDALDPIACFPPLSQEKLENLNELTLETQVFSTLTFLKFTPSLKKLVLGKYASISHSIFTKTYLSQMEDVRLSKCKELEIGYIEDDNSDSALCAEDVFNLQKWLPNVVKLKTKFLDDDGFFMVCLHWPNLEYLEICDSELTDYEITGLHKNDIAKINKSGKNWPFVGRRRRANITNLKNLQSFSIRKMNVHHKLDFSSGLCGFQELPKLRHLSIPLDDIGNDKLKQFWKRLNAQFPSQ